LIESDAIFINFAKFRDENVTDLETDALCTEIISKQLLKDTLQPSDGLCLITC